MFSLQVNRAKKKWKNLRVTYAKHVRRNKPKTGQAANSNKEWIWAKQMKGFDRYLAYATTSTNVSDIDSEVTIESAEDFENHNIRSEYSDNNFIQDTANTENPETYVQFSTSNSKLPDSIPFTQQSTPFSQQSTSFTQQSTPFTQQSTPFTQQSTPSDVLNASPEAPSRQTGKKRTSEAISPVGQLIQRYLDKKATPQYHGTDHVFLGYAKTIKTFSARSQAIAKLKIAEVVMQQELLNQQELTPSDLHHPQTTITTNYVHMSDSSDSSSFHDPTNSVQLRLTDTTEDPADDITTLTNLSTSVASFNS